MKHECEEGQGGLSEGRTLCCTGVWLVQDRPAGMEKRGLWEAESDMKGISKTGKAAEPVSVECSKPAAAFMMQFSWRERLASCFTSLRCNFESSNFDLHASISKLNNLHFSRLQ